MTTTAYHSLRGKYEVVYLQDDSTEFYTLDFDNLTVDNKRAMRLHGGAGGVAIPCPGRETW